MEQIECSETSAYKIQTPGNHPEENIKHTEHSICSIFIGKKVKNIFFLAYEDGTDRMFRNVGL
jgi:hypothetical protein